MLCKVKEAAEVSISSTPILLFSTANCNLAKQDNSIYSGNFSGEIGGYTIYGTAHSSAYNTSLTRKITLGTNTVDTNFRTPATANQNFSISDTISKETAGQEAITIKINCSRDLGSEKFYIENCYIQQTTKTIPGTTGVTGKPRSLKDISQKATTTIFGLHTDNTRITQDVE